MIQIRLRAGKVPVSTPIGTAQDIVDRDARYLSIESEESSSVVVFSSDEPSADDRDKPWVRVNTSGKPMGVFVYYNGAWTLPSYIAPVGTLAMFSGIWDVETVKYPGWVFANGLNSTIDVRIRMLKSDNTDGTTATTATDLKLGIMQYLG